MLLQLQFSCDVFSVLEIGATTIDHAGGRTHDEHGLTVNSLYFYLHNSHMGTVVLRELSDSRPDCVGYVGYHIHLCQVLSRKV